MIDLCIYMINIYIHVIYIYHMMMMMMMMMMVMLWYDLRYNIYIYIHIYIYVYMFCVIPCFDHSSIMYCFFVFRHILRIYAFLICFCWFTPLPNGFRGLQTNEALDVWTSDNLDSQTAELLGPNWESLCFLFASKSISCILCIICMIQILCVN